MEQELKNQWVAALLSEKYPQGGGQLRSPSGEFCCLGVLCDIVEPEAWAQIEDGGWAHRGVGGIPSKATLNKVGLTHKIATQLANINDNPEPFAVVAAYIEENL